MNKQEAEALRASSWILAEQLGIDRAVRDCIRWLAHESGRNMSGEGQQYFCCPGGQLELMLKREAYRETVTVHLLMNKATAVYTAWRKYPYPISPPVTIEIFKPGMWTCALLAFAEECRAELQKLAQAQEQELVEQMVEAFAPMDGWEGIDE